MNTAPCTSKLCHKNNCISLKKKTISTAKLKRELRYKDSSIYIRKKLPNQKQNKLPLLSEQILENLQKLICNYSGLLSLVGPEIVKNGKKLSINRSNKIITNFIMSQKSWEGKRRNAAFEMDLDRFVSLSFLILSIKVMCNIISLSSEIYCYGVVNINLV